MRTHLIDVSHTCPSHRVGSALAQLWTLDNGRLVPCKYDTSAAVCPITLTAIHDPVLLNDSGVIFEHDAIKTWLENNDRDPCTNLVVKKGRLLKLQAFREIVEQFLKEDGILSSRSPAVELEKTIQDIHAFGDPSVMPMMSLRAPIDRLQACLHQHTVQLDEQQKANVNAQLILAQLHREVAAREVQAASYLQNRVRIFLAERRRERSRRVLIWQARARTFQSQEFMMRLWKPRLDAATLITRWWRHICKIKQKLARRSKAKEARKERQQKEEQKQQLPRGTFIPRLRGAPVSEATIQNPLFKACNERDTLKRQLRLKGRMPPIEKRDIDLVVQSAKCTRREANLALIRFENSIIDATIQCIRNKTGSQTGSRWECVVEAWAHQDE